MPLSKNKLGKAEELVAMIKKFSVFVDSNNSFELLLDYARERNGLVWSVYLSVDPGYGREGMTSREAVELVGKIKNCQQFELEGLYCHAGHSYGVSSLEELERISKYELECLVK